MFAPSLSFAALAPASLLSHLSDPARALWPPALSLTTHPHRKVHLMVTVVLPTLRGPGSWLCADNNPSKDRGLWRMDMWHEEEGGAGSCHCESFTSHSILLVSSDPPVSSSTSLLRRPRPVYLLPPHVTRQRAMQITAAAGSHWPRRAHLMAARARRMAAGPPAPPAPRAPRLRAHGLGQAADSLS